MSASDVRFASLHLERGLKIESGGSATMVQCTSTGERIVVRPARAWPWRAAGFSAAATLGWTAWDRWRRRVAPWRTAQATA